MVRDPEFIKRLAAKGYTKREARIILDDFERVVMEAMAEGEEVQLYGFGKFGIKEVKEHQMREVHTHEWITVPGYKRPKFTPGLVFQRAVREGIVRE